MLRPLRARLVAFVCVTAMLVPSVAPAAPLEVDRKALADFEAGFNDGQKQFDGGQFIDAARTWAKAADNLKEIARHKDNRQAVYEYIADAWAKALTGNDDPALLREAVGVLDRYVDGYTVAYGTESPVQPKIAATREELKRRLATLEAGPSPTEPEGPQDTPPGDQPEGPAATGGPRWKGLAIGGGVALGVGVGLVVFGAVKGAQSKKIDGQFEAEGCDIDDLAGICVGLVDQGKRANTLAYVGGFVGGALVVTGAVLLGLGLKRRAAGRAAQALVPAFGPGFAGLTLRGAF